MITKKNEETLCDKCAHSKVCKHKDILAAVNECIEKLSISTDDGPRNQVTMVRDIDLVEIRTTCNHFTHASVTRTGTQISNIKETDLNHKCIPQLDILESCTKLGNFIKRRKINELPIG